jgi:hypothetical protein
MKKLLLLSFLFLAVPCLAQVPAPTMYPLQCIGGDGANKISSSVTKTSDGGFILSIETNAPVGTGTIDSYCTMSGNRYVYLKYNADASSFIWSKCFSYGPYIYPQADGSFIFGSFTTAVPSNGAFQITKTDGSGTPIWSKTYGGQAAYCILKSMVATTDGGFIMAGISYFTDTDFTIHHGSWTEEDIAIVKVDSNGNKLWSTVIGGSRYERPFSLVATPGGGCYIAGDTYSNDVDCTGNHGSLDAYIVKIGGSGNIIWHRDYGGSNADGAGFAIPNGKGGLIVAAGTWSSNGDVSNYIPFTGTVPEIWVLNVDSSGSIIWDNCYGGGGGECLAYSICKASDGSIWTAGVSRMYKFGQIDTAYGEDDAWIVHADSAGNFINAKVLGSTQKDRGGMVYPLSTGNVIAGGTFGVADCSFSALSGCSAYAGPFSNIFLTVFAPQNQTAVTELSESNNGVSVFPNPVSKSITIQGTQNHNYCITVTNTLGRVVYAGTFNGTIEVETETWPKGVYILVASDDEGRRTSHKLSLQ